MKLVHLIVLVAALTLVLSCTAPTTAPAPLPTPTPRPTPTPAITPTVPASPVSPVTPTMTPEAPRDLPPLAFVTNTGGYDLYIWQRNKSQTTRIKLSDPNSDFGAYSKSSIHWSADGKHIVLTGYQGLVAVDVDQQTAQFLTTADGHRVYGSVYTYLPAENGILFYQHGYFYFDFDDRQVKSYKGLLTKFGAVASLSYDGGTAVSFTLREGSSGWILQVMSLPDGRIREPVVPRFKDVDRKTVYWKSSTVFEFWAKLNSKWEFYEFDVSSDALRSISPDPDEMSLADEFFNPPWDAAIINKSPDGSIMAILSAKDVDNNDIFVYDFKQQKAASVSDNLKGSARSVFWSPDGQQLGIVARVNTSNMDDDLFVVSIADKIITPILSDAKYNESSASWSPDGSKIIFSRAPLDDLWDAQIYILDVISKQIQQVDVTGSFNEPKWSPDGKEILLTGFGSNAGQMVILNLTTRQMKNIGKGRGAVWPRGSDNIFYIDGDRDMITRINTATLEQNDVWPWDRWGWAFTVSGDGRYLAVVESYFDRSGESWQQRDSRPIYSVSIHDLLSGIRYELVKGIDTYSVTGLAWAGTK